jgi:hypothetical protein
MAKSKDSRPKHDASAGGPRYHGGFQKASRSGAKAGMHHMRGHEAGPGGGDSPGRHAHTGKIGTRHAMRAPSSTMKGG